jgi:ABC-type transport system substrate-binding protein
MKKRVFTLLAAIAILGFSLVACNPAENAPPVENTPDDSAQVEATPEGDADLPSSVEMIKISVNIQADPALIGLEDDDSILVCNHLHIGLVLATGGELSPGLASDWQLADDELDYIFTLDSGAMFSDGMPITSDVVVANFERWFDQDNPLHGSDSFEAWQSNFQGFKGETEDDGTPLSFYDGIEKVDQRTFILHLNRPKPELLEILSLPQFSIVKPDSLSGDPSDIVGAGPYMVDAWNAEGLNLIPNPNFYRESPQEELYFEFE